MPSIYIKLRGDQARGTFQISYDNDSTVRDLKNLIINYLRDRGLELDQFSGDPDQYTIHTWNTEFGDERLVVDIIKTTKYGHPDTHSVLLCTGL